MKRTIGVTALVLGVAVPTAVGLVMIWPQVQLDAAPTDPDAPPARLVCYGSVDSRQGSLLLQPARAGRIARVFVAEGQRVSKNEPLVQLDDRPVKLQEREADLAAQAAGLQLAKARDGLKQYQAKRAEAEAAVRAAGAKAVAARYALAIEQRHLDASFSSDDRVAAAQAQLDAATAAAEVEQHRLSELAAVDPEADVRLARLHADRCQVQLDRARQEREEYLLRAPADGTVLRVQAQEGDLAGPAALRPAVWLDPAGGRIVRAEVAQEFAGRVRKGLAVQVEDEETAAALAEGQIAVVADWFLPRRQLSAQPTGINSGLAVEAVIDLQPGHAPLRLGQRVRVRVLADPPGRGPI